MTMAHLAHVPTVKLGSQNIRFIYWNQADTVTVRKELVTRPDHADEIVLFMACDVLASNVKNSKNHARFHARLGEKHMAVKLNFKAQDKYSVLFGYGNFWFYTVKGLFKAAFDCLGTDIQKSCLEQLTNTWIECTGSLFLDCMVSVSQIIIDDSTTSNPLPDVNITPGAVVLQANLDNALQCHLHQEPESNVMPKVDLVADTLRGITAQVIPSTSLPQSKESNLTRKRRYTPELNTTGTTNPTKNDTNINTVNLHDLVTTLCTQLERTGCMSQSGLTVTEEQSEMYREIENIVTKDTSEAREETNLSTSYGFPFHLIHRYLAIIKDPSQRKNFASTFNIPLSTNVAVSVIADWLGNIFRSLGSDVMQRVEEFKRENITSINALPASEELVCKLFPQCMIRLMLAWMGNEDSPVLDTLSSDSQPASSPVAGGGSSIGSTSTCYVSKSYCSTITDIPRASTKHSTEQQQHVSHHIDKIYALAQIILEFANNTLVSGVAHVVYSRL